MAKQLVTLESHRNFRLRLVLATLAHVPVKIQKIRADDVNPGLRDYEISFLRLLESLTNGSTIEISYTGTTVIYKPGLLIGGQLTFNCNPSRAIGYYIEYILLLAPFAKNKFSIVFKGIDSDSHETIGLEGVKWGLLPIMEKFGVRDVELRILKRGAPPGGGAEAHLMVNQLLAAPLTIHALELPKIAALRGVAYSTRVSPSIVNRIVEAARQVFSETGCRTDIVADAWRGEVSGSSPGWGVTLVAESKKGWRFFVEEVGSAGETPEDIGTKAAYELLEEASMSGVVCRSQLPLALGYMVIGKEHIGRMIINKQQVDPNFIHLLRDVKNLVGVEAHIKPCDDYLDEQDVDDYLVLMVKGVGFTNANKKIA
ncbi:rRNA-processing endoribonuclease [Saccharomycopsis crataegensis]|uniref:rRNA-processing endoribonuclease n=1 Tax=Saccharomycopsis crataegensis TaxID=43959 RepID=A0AAV5QY91_9ASCO|nr:rRNA-processing endoribonuclease [Saccharomycopsis crataegensis]